MATYEIEIKTTEQMMVDVGPPASPILANLEVYNGKIGPVIPHDFPAIPGNLNPGDTLIVRLINDLPHPTGIHWHGIELQSNADGTPVTQAAVPGGDLQVLGGIGGAPVGGTYLYRFQVPRPGIFWFHPHHFHSTNRVFRGLYGMIVVTDPNEAALIPSVLPPASQSYQIILSDITVCSATNPPFDPSLPWAGPGGVLPVQPGFSPSDLCTASPVNEDGSPGPAFSPGDVPNLQRSAGRINEGITVLSNGRNVGGRSGTPSAPGALEAMAETISVQPGQGIRLQIVNCATTRYFRLLLTEENGNEVDLVRIGGEGGLLDHAMLEGRDPPVPAGQFDPKYTQGEILLPPAARADVVAAIPSTANGTLTLWTQDFQRLPGQGGWANIPTVPVLHLAVSGPAVSPAYSITGGINDNTGTPLRAAFPGQEVESLLALATTPLLDPSTFTPSKLGSASEDIQLTSGPPPGINGQLGSFSGSSPYWTAPHINQSSRYAKEGDVLELQVSNMSGAHHPFHLHGFSFQPISLGPVGGSPTFTWQYREFLDTLDVPSNHTLTFRVRIESSRTLQDGVTLGGSLGRWLFHCHIFFHAHRGMLSELVITDADGSGDEKPNIDVGGSWAYAPTGGVASRSGTYFLPDGDTLDTIVAHLEDGTPIGDVTTGAGTWNWVSHTPPDPPLSDQTTYVYLTITGQSGRKDQTLFRLKIGGADDGSDNGDPHLRAVDGTRYDFQAAGEFILLRDRDGLEVQTRQTPVVTANPINDSYSGIKACVSVNTAVAARVGSHTISYQPGPEPGELVFYVDGKRSRLDTRGMDLDEHRVTGFDADGRMGLRIDYAHAAVVTVTPRFWSSHDMHYMNVSVARTQATEGIMGPIAEGSWLPRLSSGATVGPKPNSVGERYVQLYKTFADSWRVTDKSSLFAYASGTSTETFTDRDWPAEKPPCALKAGFEIPGAPALRGMPVDEAKRVCKGVTEDDLFDNCVFDVATTGDKTFADGYLFEQELRLKGTAVQIVPEKPDGDGTDGFRVLAAVSTLKKDRPMPKGTVTFYVDNEKAGDPVELDEKGYAFFDATRTKPGARIRAEYSDGKGGDLIASSSSSLIRPEHIKKDREEKDEKGKGSGRNPYIFVVLLILILLVALMLLL